MINITRWAGRHPLFVRIVLLPILFYLQGRLAFVAGANLFFDGLSLPAYWVWAMIGILWVAAFIYPENAKEIMRAAYWRIKGLEWVACTAAFGLWFYAGNQMAQQYEGVSTATQMESQLPKTAALFSERVMSEEVPAKESKVEKNSSERITVDKEKRTDNKLVKAYRQYFKNAISTIKHGHGKQGIPTALGIVLGVIGIGLGIVILVCGIQCGGTGGGIALGVIGGLALIGLGVWALIAGLRKTSAN